ELEDCIDRLLLRGADEGAGVDDDHLGFGWLPDERVPGAGQGSEHDLGIDPIFRATECFHVQAFLERLIRPRHRIPIPQIAPDPVRAPESGRSAIGIAQVALNGELMHHSRLSTVVIDCKTEDIDAAAEFWSRARRGCLWSLRSLENW